MTDHGLSTDDILARLRTGHPYEASQIAYKFGLPTASLRATLEAMLQAGQLKGVMLQKGPRIYQGYVRPELTPEAAEPLNTSVAEPRSAPDLKANLTGYDLEIRIRAELCMLTRAR